MDDIHILKEFPKDYPIAVERRIAMALDRDGFQNATKYSQDNKMPTGDTTWPTIQVNSWDPPFLELL